MHHHDSTIALTRNDAIHRLEAAVTLLTQAEAGRVEYSIAVPGAIPLIDQALAAINGGWSE